MTSIKICDIQSCLRYTRRSRSNKHNSCNDSNVFWCITPKCLKLLKGFGAKIHIRQNKASSIMTLFSEKCTFLFGHLENLASRHLILVPLLAGFMLFLDYWHNLGYFWTIGTI
jgi:hypothetical protein